jgi:hypothetical protein
VVRSKLVSLPVLLANTLALCLGPPTPATATEPTPTPELLVTEVALGTSMGFDYLDPARLNRAFETAGLPTLARWNWTPLAINGELWINRHVPGIDFVQRQNGGDRTGTDAGGTNSRMQLTQLSYGYAFVHLDNGFSLVPRIGAGIWETHVHSWTAGGQQLFGDPGLGDVTTLRKSGMYADLGLSITGLIAFGPRDRLGVASGLRISLRIGATIQLFNFGGRENAWKSEGRPVSGVPDFRIDGPYARIVIAPSFLHRSVRPPKRPKAR